MLSWGGLSLGPTPWEGRSSLLKKRSKKLLRLGAGIEGVPGASCLTNGSPIGIAHQLNSRQETLSNEMVGRLDGPLHGREIPMARGTHLWPRDVNRPHPGSETATSDPVGEYSRLVDVYGLSVRASASLRFVGRSGARLEHFPITWRHSLLLQSS